MSPNPIEQVKEAESSAEALLKEAQREAAHRKQDAEAKGRQMLEHTRDMVQLEADAVIQSAQEKVDGLLTDAIAALEDEANILRRQAEERQPQAVKAILDLINE